MSDDLDDPNLLDDPDRTRETLRVLTEGWDGPYQGTGSHWCSFCDAKTLPLVERPDGINGGEYFLGICLACVRRAVSLLGEASDKR